MDGVLAGADVKQLIQGGLKCSLVLALHQLSGKLPCPVEELKDLVIDTFLLEYDRGGQEGVKAHPVLYESRSHSLGNNI